jgi:hypothetical protein
MEEEVRLLQWAFIACGSYKLKGKPVASIYCLKINWRFRPCIFACSQHQSTFRQAARLDEFLEILLQHFSSNVDRNQFVRQVVSAVLLKIWSNFETQSNLYTMAGCPP